MHRRDFCRLAAGTALYTGLGSSLMSCGRGGSTTNRKVVVLGIDGLDPTILKGLMDLGRVPNFSKLARMGSFMKLGTTMPALSPVAWSSFITGQTPGGHWIADFIVRDPKTSMPMFSIYETRDPDRMLRIGNLRIPVSGGGTFNLRRGRPFWAHLTERGIPAFVSKMPTDFPVGEDATCAISGLGTPDLIDSYGSFSYYTSDPFEDYPGLSGGIVTYVDVDNDTVRTELIGPYNSLLEPVANNRDEFANNTRIPFRVYLDPERDSVRIDIEDRSIVLRKGEFSEWVKVQFELAPVLGGVSGIVRFLLKEVRPHLRLYVTPINIDPEDQAMQITYPEELGGELAREIGPFWTKGLPADTKAFDYGVFNDEDYVKQSELILRERLVLFDALWSRFESGMFFFYVSNADQDAHMLWRNMDETHPTHDASDLRFSGHLHYLYEEMDKLVGKVLPAVDDGALLLVCSDHGFASFGRQFHLNTWLRREGYLTVKPEAAKKEETDIHDVDWSRTLAYGIGFNALYLNLQGREGQGIVSPEQAESLVKRLGGELEGLTDSETGLHPVARVYRKEEVYSGELVPGMPEMLVGYRPGYRASSPSVLGSTGSSVIEINPWTWSGDHSMARDLVPGTLLSSRPVRKPNPEILDLPVSILEFFGIERPVPMVGSSIFRV